MEAKRKDCSAQWWWLDSDSKGTSNRSPWLRTTIAELDAKTRAMLQVIEEDADSFAKRAEMYYRKRPELIGMVEDFYRTHRSLAEHYDQVKAEHGTARLLSSPSSPWSSSSPLPFTKYRLEKSMSLNEIDAYDSYSEACGPGEESDESEVDDPEEKEQEIDDVANSAGDNDVEIMRMKEEVRRVNEENESQRKQLKEKDEEKREVIRQLSVAMELLREENQMLRDCLAKKSSPNKDKDKDTQIQIEYNKLKQSFFGKLLNGFGKAPVIAI